MTNQDLLSIAKEFGTPVYVYDVNSIREQYEKLTSSFSKNTRFFYANQQTDEWEVTVQRFHRNVGILCL